MEFLANQRKTFENIKTKKLYINVVCKVLPANVIYACAVQIISFIVDILNHNLCCSMLSLNNLLCATIIINCLSSTSLTFFMRLLALGQF